jgi:hypothetical protein
MCGGGSLLEKLGRGVKKLRPAAHVRVVRHLIKLYVRRSRVRAVRCVGF